MRLISEIILFILSIAALSLNSCSYIFNGEHISFEYDSYINPYINILHLLNLNDIEQNELEVYAKVAIEYICNSKCKYNNCKINGSIYNYDEDKCIRAKLYENLIKEYESLNHLFQHCTLATALAYGSIEETISKEVLNDIVSWIGSIK